MRKGILTTINDNILPVHRTQYFDTLEELILNQFSLKDQFKPLNNCWKFFVPYLSP